MIPGFVTSLYKITYYRELSKDIQFWYLLMYTCWCDTCVTSCIQLIYGMLKCLLYVLFCWIVDLQNAEWFLKNNDNCNCLSSNYKFWIDSIGAFWRHYCKIVCKLIKKNFKYPNVQILFFSLSTCFKYILSTLFLYDQPFIYLYITLTL